MLEFMGSDGLLRAPMESGCDMSMKTPVPGKAVLILPLLLCGTMASIFGEGSNDGTPDPSVLPPPEFYLDVVDAFQGEEAVVGVHAVTAVPLRMLTMEIGFDRSGLRLLGMERILSASRDQILVDPMVTDTGMANFDSFEMTNDGGSVSMQLKRIIPWTEPTAVQRDLHLLDLKFLVFPRAEVGFHPVVFKSIRIGDNAEFLEANSIQNGGVRVREDPIDFPTPDPPICTSPAVTDVFFSLGDRVAARRGEIVTLTFSANSNSDLKTLRVALDFDEDKLELRSLRRSDPTDLPDLWPVGFNWAEFSNQAGWLALFLGNLAQEDGALPLPPDGPVAMFELEFFVRPTAQSGITTVAFREIPKSIDITYTNRAILACAVAGVGDEVVPSTQDGEIDIIGEVGFFMRGDSDFSRQYDISDPIFSLNYLFLGSMSPECLDAADANDDGSLDVSDIIYTLKTLYETGEPFPPPEWCGPDPTDEDPLDCNVLDCTPK